MRAKHDPESNRGNVHQSMAPAEDTRAAEWQSPMSA